MYTTARRSVSRLLQLALLFVLICGLVAPYSAQAQTAPWANGPLGAGATRGSRSTSVPLSAVIVAASSLTPDSPTVTVNEGTAAVNSGTYTHAGPAPLTLSASVGAIGVVQTLFSR